MSHAVLDARRHKRLYAQHSGLGIALGVLLFFVSWTGTVAVFHEELTTFEDPGMRIALPERTAPAEAAIDRYLAAVPAGVEVSNLVVEFPRPATPFHVVRATQRAEDGPRESVEARYHPETGERLADAGRGPSLWFLDLHRHLMIERTLGRALVGVFGVLMLVLVAGGVLTHRKILRELLTLRVHRSVRLKWKDGHNVLGAWGLPFHAMIAFTGAWLGLVAVYLPLMAFLAFGGDQEAAARAVLGEGSEPSGRTVATLTVDEAAAAVEAETGLAPRIAILEHRGDANGRYRMLVEPPRALVRYATVDVEAATGTVGAVKLAGEFGDDALARVSAALTPLHYGTFGGVPLKLLYGALGVGLCVMIALGLMVWTERRASSSVGRRTPAFYRRLACFHAGATTGLPLATVLVLLVDRWVPVAPDARLAMAGTVHLGGWLLVTVLALAGGDARRATARTLLATAGTCIVLAVAEYATTGAALVSAGQRHALGTVATLLAAGSAAGLVGARLRRGAGAGETPPVAPSALAGVPEH